jgi:PRC-barrel domain
LALSRPSGHPVSTEVGHETHSHRFQFGRGVGGRALVAGPPASTQEVALVAPDAKEVAKGYRAEELKLRLVANDKGDIIGHIDDFIFGRDNGPVFVVLSVGDFVGLGGELVAVPFKSLKLDDSSGKIVLPGASLAALRKLPVFLYNR